MPRELGGMPHSLPFASHSPGGMLQKLQGKRLEILFGFLAARAKTLSGAP